MKPSRMRLILLSLICSYVFGLNNAQAQNSNLNPLIRPKLPTRDAVPPLPGGKLSGNETPQAKSAQEEMTVKLQQLNADRIPMPLRLLLAPIYVSAMLGDTAILRQPLQQFQQIGLVGAMNTQLTGQGIPGNLNTASIPQTGMAGLPGMNAMPSGFGATAQTIPGGFLPGMTPGFGSPGFSQLGGVGFAQAQQRPTSIRVKDGEKINLYGFELLAKVNRNQVRLDWIENIEKPVIVYQSGIEPVNQTAYIPPSAILERADQQYFNRSQATNAQNSAASGSTQPSANTSAGIGGR